MKNPVIATILSSVGIAVLIGGSPIVALVDIASGWQAVQLTVAWLIGAALFIAADVRWIQGTDRKRWGRFWVSVAISVPVLVFMHPFIIGLPGRLGEALFLVEISTHPRQYQVQSLVTGTGGEQSPYVGGSAEYLTFGTICVATYDEVHVAFDNDGRANGWFVDHRGEFC